VRPALPVLIVLLVAGCAAPAVEPDTTRGLDLAGRVGTLLLGLDDDSVQLLTPQQGLAWMSPSGALVTWTGVDFAIALDRATGERDVVPLIVWSRIDDDGTGLELRAGEARTRDLLTGAEVRNTTLPPPPGSARAWTYASADLAVLGAEHAEPGAAACAHEIHVRAPELTRATGCHLEVSRDGRVGWTEGDDVRILQDGAPTVWSSAQGPAPDEPVRHENPLFTGEGTIALRIRGSADATVSEVVDEDGQVLAMLEGPRQIALLDVSEDARWLLVRIFTR
jgi:hypothetical protein